MYTEKKANISINQQPLTFLDALCLMLIGFKLTNIIDWSWFWVLSPLWITLIIAVGVSVVYGLLNRKT